MKRQGGFTLLELLAAIVVFGVMSAIAYQGLVSVAVTDETLEEDGHAMADLQLAMGLVERDLRQAVPRSVRDALGQPMPALAGSALGLSMTRAGWSNPTARPRSHLERVDYQFEGGTLLRLGWPVLDRTQGSVAEVSELLSGLESWDVSYRDDEGEWHRRWPPDTASIEGDHAPWPRAVSVAFSAPRYGRIERLFSLVEAPNPSRRQGPPPGVGDG